MSINKETLDMFKQARAEHSDEIAKSFTAPGGNPTQGFQAYNLENAAKVNYPVPLKLVPMIPRQTMGFSNTANWKALNKISNPNFYGGVGEAQRGLLVGQNLVEYSAEFKTVGVENSVTLQADLAAKNFEDLKALATLQSVQNLMISEEKIMLFGNGKFSLGQTNTPVVTAGPAGTISGDVSVIVVALTAKGMGQSSLANGLPTALTLKNVLGEDIDNRGFHAQPSVATLITGVAGGINVFVAPKKNEFGYAVYAGPAGSERLQAISNSSSITLSSLSTTTQLFSAINNIDNSRDPLIYDGLITLSNSASGAYYKHLSADGVKRSLTPDGAGGIVEIEEALAYYYDVHKIAPTHLFVSAQEMQTIRQALLSGPNANLYRLNLTSPATGITGGSKVISYFNQYASGVGVEDLKIVLHPYMPSGTMLFFTDTLPYPANGIPTICRMNMRRDYFQIEWPMRTLKTEYGVYCDGVLQHYAPFTLGVITGIAKQSEATGQQ